MQTDGRIWNRVEFLTGITLKHLDFEGYSSIRIISFISAALTGESFPYLYEFVLDFYQSISSGPLCVLLSHTLGHICSWTTLLMPKTSLRLSMTNKPSTLWSPLGFRSVISKDTSWIQQRLFFLFLTTRWRASFLQMFYLIRFVVFRQGVHYVTYRSDYCGRT